MVKILLPPVPPASSDAVRASMRGNKSLKTRPETILEEELRRAGIDKFLQNPKELPGSPDFAFPYAKLAVFVHGCFWHRCPHCQPHFPDSNPKYWEAKFLRNTARDRRMRTLLRTQGWKTMVIWECQVKKNPQRAASRIIKALEKTNG